MERATLAPDRLLESIAPAALLEASVVSVNSALQRARATLRGRLPERRTEWARSSGPREEERELLRRYVDAHERGDVEALAELLREDARLTMPPHPTWYEGREAILIASQKGPSHVRRDNRLARRPNAERPALGAGWQARPGGRVAGQRRGCLAAPGSW
jgi:RNA polymerase sigma-70 factor, ECF subfamily